MALPTVGDFLSQAKGLFEPQRKYNFSVEIFLPNQKDQENIQLAVESFALPNDRSEVITLNYGNIVRYVAGKTSFQARSLVLKDFVDVGTAQALSKWRQRVYNPLTDSMGLARDYKSIATIVLGAPDGTHERYWDLIGIWPSEVQWGDIGQDNGLVMITATIQMDKAIPRITPSVSVSIPLPTG